MDINLKYGDDSSGEVKIKEENGSSSKGRNPH